MGTSPPEITVVCRCGGAEATSGGLWLHPGHARGVFGFSWGQESPDCMVGRGHRRSKSVLPMICLLLRDWLALCRQLQRMWVLCHQGPVPHPPTLQLLSRVSHGEDSMPVSSTRTPHPPAYTKCSTNVSSLSSLA